MDEGQTSILGPSPSKPQTQPLHVKKKSNGHVESRVCAPSSMDLTVLCLVPVMVGPQARERGKRREDKRRREKNRGGEEWEKEKGY